MWVIYPPDFDPSKQIKSWSELRFVEFDLVKVPGKDNEYAAAYGDFTKLGDYNCYHKTQRILMAGQLLCRRL
jgi:hypothetical protein